MLEIAFALNWGILTESGYGLAPFSLKVNLVKRLLPFTDRVMGCPTCPVHVPASAQQGTRCSCWASLLSQSQIVCLSLSPPSTFLSWGFSQERSLTLEAWVSCFLKIEDWSDSLCSLPFGNSCRMTFALVIKVPPPKKKKNPSTHLLFIFLIVLWTFSNVKWKPRPDKTDRNLYCESSRC